jgi:hypothetical protein
MSILNKLKSTVRNDRKINISEKYEVELNGIIIEQVKESDQFKAIISQEKESNEERYKDGKKCQKKQ